MELTKTIKIASDHTKFLVSHRENTYDVDICHTPTCSCPDNRSCLCKHILWVYLYVQYRITQGAMGAFAPGFKIAE